MILALTLLLILTATLLIGWWVRRLEKRNPVPLDQNQIKALGQMAESMKKGMGE